MLLFWNPSLHIVSIDYMGKVKIWKSLCNWEIHNRQRKKYFHQVLSSPSLHFIVNFCVAFLVTDYTRIQLVNIFNNLESICRSFFLANSWFTSFMFLTCTYINIWSNAFIIYFMRWIYVLFWIWLTIFYSKWVLSHRFIIPDFWQVIVNSFI